MAQQPAPARSASRWRWAAGYLVLFFGSMTLAGILFLFAGVALVLVPGSLPLWAEVGYILLGIVGTVGTAVLATNGAFHRRVRAVPVGAPSSVVTQARAVRWLASLTGALVIAALAAVARVVVTRLIEG